MWHCVGSCLSPICPLFVLWSYLENLDAKSPHSSAVNKLRRWVLSTCDSCSLLTTPVEWRQSETGGHSNSWKCVKIAKVHSYGQAFYCSGDTYHRQTKRLKTMCASGWRLVFIKWTELCVIFNTVVMSAMWLVLLHLSVFCTCLWLAWRELRRCWPTLFLGGH